MLTVHCQSCGASFLLPETAAGQETRCGACGAVIQVRGGVEESVRRGPVADGAWEYLLLPDRGRMGHVDQVKLNELGLEGWELVSVYRENPDGHTNYYFKRPLGSE